MPKPPKAKVEVYERVRRVLKSPNKKEDEVPKIIFEGIWLMDFGFAVGTEYKLICDLGKIIIQKNG
jgi:hypothetical protein